MTIVVCLQLTQSYKKEAASMLENMFTNYERKVVSRLAAIEQQDEEVCSGCGGEDCQCCGIYQDRQKWQSPSELSWGEF